MLKPYRIILTTGLLLFTLLAQAYPGDLAHRDFWRPIFKGKRLNYCLSNGKTCGLTVAKHFCRRRGYADATQSSIEYNVGCSSFLQKRNLVCAGLKCHGFKVIRCVRPIRHIPIKPYYYRERKFVLPKFRHRPVDWCLARGQYCGKYAANSYCKKRGYLYAKAFRKRIHLPITRTIGSQQLCVGGCVGFAELICYR